jgi:uncharacterized membrane protein YkvA (DUF1232 family)
MEKFLEKVALWLEKIRSTPVLGSLVEDLITMTQLVSDCLKGIYEELPRGTVIGILAALFYAFSPVDLILDIIPFAGYLDDAAVISLILELGLARDLMQYRDWKRQKRLEAIEVCRKDLVLELLDAIGENELAAAYLTEDRRIRLLLAKPGDLSRPLPCRTRYVAIDEARLAALDLADWEQLGDFFSQLFRDSRFRWSRFGRQPFRPEYACQIDDAFILVD